MRAFDTETGLITDLCYAPPLVCVSHATDQIKDIFKWNGEGLPPEGVPRDPKPQLRAWLREALCGHNTAYDTVVFAANMPELIPDIFEAYERGLVHDTMLRQKLLDIALGCFRWDYSGETPKRVNYHLIDLTHRHLGYARSKGEDTYRLRYIELYNVPLESWPAAATEYAIEDSADTLAVYNAQERHREAIRAASGLDVLADEASQCRKAFWLQLVSAWGMQVHPEKIATLAKALSDEVLEIRTILSGEPTGAIEIDHRDNCEHEGCLVCEMLAEDAASDSVLIRRDVKKKTGEVKYVRDTAVAGARMLRIAAEQGREVAMTRGGTKPKADGTLAPPKVKLDEESCEDSDDPILRGYAHYSKLSTILNKDVHAMLAGEIHGNYDSLVATGRTSCRGQGKGKGMNLQNPPRKGGVRECFAPRAGMTYCFIDLDIAELRAVAQVCINLGIHSRLAEALNAGQDPHLILAAMIMGISYEDAVTKYKAGDMSVTDARQIAKSCNFGFAGGMGAKKFRTYLKANSGRVVSLEEAQFYRNAWLSTWPEFHAYFAYHASLVEANRPLVQHYSGRVRSNLTFSEACNTEFQGLIADAMAAAGWRVARMMYDVTRGNVLFGSRMVNFVHDELICEVPEAIAHECAQEIQRIVLEEVGRFLPNVPPKATPYLANTWSKKAKPVYDNGRLVPWQMAA